MLLSRVTEELARKAGDQQRMAVARQNAEDEDRIAAHWSKFVALSSSEEGVS